MTDQTATSPEMSTLTGSWTLDTAGTTVAFTTKAMWVLPVRATVTAQEGSGIVGDDGSVRGTLVLDAASIDTKNKKRDEHLRGGDFFEVSTFPTFVVNVLGATPTSSGGYALDTTLTIHGQERPVKLAATVVAGNGVATVTVETDIDRSQWGVTRAKLGAGLTNHVVISARFAKD